jgi:hypothetical protein
VNVPLDGDANLPGLIPPCVTALRCRRRSLTEEEQARAVHRVATCNCGSVRIIAYGPTVRVITCGKKSGAAFTANAIWTRRERVS